MTRPTVPLLAVAFALVVGSAACRPERQDRPRTGSASAPAASAFEFPTAAPEEVGIPAAALERLTQRVQTMVDDESIVGGELVVIKNRRTVLRKAFGWSDRDSDARLEVDAVYCVRSMTKPLVGTAVQMLIDDGKLALDTPVHTMLPAFAAPQTRAITVEHLLTHTSGFPFTTIRKPLSEYADLAAVAAEAAATELSFAPGTRFEYSDAGSDTLGAIVAHITGAPVEEFIEQRVLAPLGMTDTIPLLAGRPTVLARVPSAYSGGTGAWSRHWSSADPPIFPLFLTSQSMYSTTTDYARFLTLWMDRGRIGHRQLLSPAAVDRALSPRHHMADYPNSFGRSNTYYGHQWMVYAEPVAGGAPHMIAFGHNGSDGTHAWAWPTADLIVLFFTQSRGTVAGLALEPALHTLLVEQNLDAPMIASDPAQLEQLAGLYWDETAPAAYYVVTRHGAGLAVERPGRMRAVFKPAEPPGRYVHEASSRAWLEFVRDDDGAVVAMKTSFGGKVELDPRHVPPTGLPSVSEVVALVEKGHRLSRLPKLGVVGTSGTIAIEPRGLEGTVTSWFDATRARDDVQFDAAVEQAVVNGNRVWSYSSVSGAEELDGARRETVLLDRAAVRFGDWTQHYETVEVLKRIKAGGRSVLVVRVVPREALGATMIVDEATGYLIRSDALVRIPGMGIVGIETKYDDVRNVGGMRLPFRSVAKFSSKLIGRVTTTIDTANVGVKVSAQTFSAPMVPKN